MPRRSRWQDRPAFPPDAAPRSAAGRRCRRADPGEQRGDRRADGLRRSRVERHARAAHQRPLRGAGDLSHPAPRPRAPLDLNLLNLLCAVANLLNGLSIKLLRTALTNVLTQLLN